jgi:hypothetical protein
MHQYLRTHDREKEVMLSLIIQPKLDYCIKTRLMMNDQRT